MLKEFKIFQVKKDLIDADLQPHLLDAFFDNMMNGTEQSAFALAVNNTYKFVAWINASDLDGVFRASNMGHEDQVVRFAKMHSLSVGDIIQDDQGSIWICSSFGFEEANSLDGYIRKSFAESTYEEVGA
jgi:hypothetical protein